MLPSLTSEVALTAGVRIRCFLGRTLYLLNSEPFAPSLQMSAAVLCRRNPLQHEGDFLARLRQFLAISWDIRSSGGLHGRRLNLRRAIAS